MTRAEQLAFCNQCCNRKMDLQQGMICNLTDQKATFNNTCTDFIQDEDKRLSASHRVQTDITIDDLSPKLLEKFQQEQNLPVAVIFGFVAGILGAVLWAMITVATGWQIGYMAIAIGFMVGHAVRIGGKGIAPTFGFIGAGIAVLSCFIGNFFSVIAQIADYSSLGYFETLYMFDYGQFFPVMAETFGIIDLLFYGFAAFEGWKFAFRQVSQEDLQ
ncbi:hypothetical protein [Nonlabens xiamenensis]|uniref:hypothetical protein n=1 Tax=Nonlabens xiamenensis TaxID=2341043 RepID=UPI000F60E7C6|nr:hypothetical protein [Nonlabens xiamenensis]